MTAPTAKPRPRPIAGPLFHQAAKLHRGSADHRRVLCLLAGFADAGNHRPTMPELAERIRLPEHRIFALIDDLQADGWLTVRRRKLKPRRLYELHLEAGERP
jgi:DNA-binding MarR family transcriptional regulator